MGPGEGLTVADEDVVELLDEVEVVVELLDDVDDANEDVELAVDAIVVLLAKIEEEDSQSSGMLFPSSSSRESGARVQAGPGVSLLRELLEVLETVVAVEWPSILHPNTVKSIVSQVVDDEVEVVTVVDARKKNDIVVAETVEDKNTSSLQKTLRSVTVL
jgi:hypothetical protein